MLTDRGTEYCGAADRHPYELYLAVENIDHTRTKTKHPPTNGICERFNKTVLNEFHRVAFRNASTRRSTPCRPTWTPSSSLPHDQAAPRALVLREDPDADVSRQPALAKEKQIA